MEEAKMLHNNANGWTHETQASSGGERGKSIIHSLTSCITFIDFSLDFYSTFFMLSHKFHCCSRPITRFSLPTTTAERIMQCSGAWHNSWGDRMRNTKKISSSFGITRRRDQNAIWISTLRAVGVTGNWLWRGDLFGDGFWFNATILYEL